MATDTDKGVGSLVYSASAFVDGLTKAEADELRDAFDLFDKNGDGKISREELGPVLRALGRNPTRQELDLIMYNADIDDSGYLSFEEYAKVIYDHLTPLGEVKKGLREAFKVFDQDKSGYLNLHELQSVICTVGDALTQREATLVLDALDTNKDGKVDADEFVEFLCDKV